MKTILMSVFLGCALFSGACSRSDEPATSAPRPTPDLKADAERLQQATQQSRGGEKARRAGVRISHARCAAALGLASANSLELISAGGADMLLAGANAARRRCSRRSKSRLSYLAPTARNHRPAAACGPVFARPDDPRPLAKRLFAVPDASFPGQRRDVTHLASGTSRV